MDDLEDSDADLDTLAKLPGEDDDADTTVEETDIETDDTEDQE